MRTSALIPLLILPTLLALLAGCPPPAAADAGPDGGGGSALLDGGPPADAGDTQDAGPADAGPGDAGVEGDAGWQCLFPELPPPTDAGTQDGGPADCTLENAEGTGHFDGTWEGQVFGTLPLVGAFDLPARGEVSFDILCGQDKLLVSGTLDGEARSSPDAGPDDPTFPFGGPLWGEFDLATGEIQMIVSPATLTLGVFNGTFEVALTGMRANDSFDMGGWCGVSIDPSGANGLGSWNATLR